jgi:GNAT superfamily N-acetyltransferase
MEELLGEMVQARLPWIAPRIRSWYDDQHLADQLAAWLATEAGRVGDSAFGTDFRDAVDPGLEPDPLCWANRRLELGAGGWAVAGIRFRGLDRDKPFVDVVATDRPPTPDGIAAVAADVLPAFARFQPLCLRVDAPYDVELAASLDDDPRFAQGRSAVDQHIVAGLVSELLAKRPTSPDADEVTLRPGEPELLAERTAAIYSQHSEATRPWATPEDADSLADCAAQGLLFELLVGGAPAGVVAATRDDAHGMSGFSVEELCLDPSWRGRGIAARAVRQLVGQLPARRGAVLWGSIHPENLPSLRAALSLGREIVGGYVWVTPQGLPGMP